MANGTFIKLQAEFTNTAIPKLYRDKVITAGTKYCFDTLDTFSFAKQAAPVAGVDVWKNLLDGGPTAAFTGSLGFSKGGFDFAAAGQQTVVLPASGISASSAEAFATAVWISCANDGTNQGIFGGADNFTDTTNQYSAHFFMNGGNAELKMYQGSRNVTVAINPLASEIVQLGWSAKKRASDGKYDLGFYKNGVLISQQVSVGTALATLTAQPLPRIGALNGNVGNSWPGRAYRAWFDDCSIKTGAELIGIDYQQNAGRIAAAAA